MKWGKYIGFFRFAVLSSAFLCSFISVTISATYADAPAIADKNQAALEAEKLDATAKASADVGTLQDMSPTENIPRIEKADAETLATAAGYYARARSLLIAAIREFDKGTKVANPDAILKSKEWRSELAARAEELNHILAPQARATKSGIRFQADRRLLTIDEKE